MRIDDHDFESTAKAVFIMNDSARDLHDSWEDLKSFMVDMAYSYCHESNSFSTGGFCLTAYDDHAGERVVRASVMGYVARLYTEKVERIKEAVGDL